MTLTLMLIAICSLFLIFMNAFLAHKKALRDAKILFAKNKLADAERLSILLNNVFIPSTKSLKFLLCNAINRNAVEVLNHLPENQSAMHLATMSKNIFDSLDDSIDETQDHKALESFTMPTGTKEIEFFREYIRTVRRFLRREIKSGTIDMSIIKNEIKTINFLQIRLSINESLQNAKVLSNKSNLPENNIYIDNVERLFKSPYLTEYPLYLNRTRSELNSIKRKLESSLASMPDDFGHHFNSAQRLSTAPTSQSSSDGLDRMLENGLKPKLY